jgi:hypothetical protein
MSHLRVPVTAGRAAAPEPGSLPATGHTAADPASPLKLAADPPLHAEQSLPVAASPSRTDLKIAQIGGDARFAEAKR